MWSEAGKHNNRTIIFMNELTDIDLADEFEVVAGAVAGLDDGLAPVEAGSEHHAQAVHVRSTGALPLVQNLGSCAQNEK